MHGAVIIVIIIVVIVVIIVIIVVIVIIIVIVIVVIVKSDLAQNLNFWHFFQKKNFPRASYWDLLALQNLIFFI